MYRIGCFSVWAVQQGAPGCKCDISFGANLFKTFSNSIEETKSKYAQSITIEIHYLSNEKNPGWLCYIGDEKLPSYIGIIKKKHYKDPY